nr:glycoside hydrolase family 20 zincin-like fold domain-containing protein [uncultured Actinotalea sp.]
MASLGILPAPVRAHATSDVPFTLGPGVRVVVGDEAEAVGVGVLVADRIGRLGSFPVAMVHTDDGASGSVVLRLAAPPDAGPAEVAAALRVLGLDPALPGDLAREAYRLSVATDRVEVVAVTAAGLVRGVVSLLQMVDLGDGAWPRVRCGTVVDHPRLPWRGVLVDVSEAPLALPDAKSLVNLLATLKLNVLHIRVADGVAWVTEVLDEGGEVASGFAELQAYAGGRHIAVVPEIDVAEELPDAETARVLSRVATTTRSHVVHVGGLGAGSDDAAGRRCGDRVGRAADEVAAAGAVVMAWQCAAPALSAARHPRHLLQVRDVRAAGVRAAVDDGARLVLSPPGLDLGRGEGGLRERYAVDPVGDAAAAGLPPTAVHGVEAVLGGRHGGTRDGLFAALLPDLAAVAEMAWSGPGATGWSSFATRVEGERPRWALNGLPVPAPVR